MKRKLRWMRLDNAAKVYPAAKRRNWNNVFRLSVTLAEPVDRAVLQSALGATIRRFPSMAGRLRRGMFWYYLEEVPRPPKVKRDSSYPLVRMPFDDIRKCAFRVLYYGNRIAVEFFHALTDGNGGLVFLKTLTAEYLSQKYGAEIPAENGVLDRREEPREEELADSFPEHTGLVSRSRAEKTAFRLEGTREEDGFKHITTGILDVDQVLREAKSYGVSLTTYIAAVMIWCIMGMQAEKVPKRKKQKMVKVLIPANLRKMFPSQTLRNFVLYITPGIDPRMGAFTFPEVVRELHHQLGLELTAKQMSARITANVKAEQSPILKVFPLFLKNLGVRLIYDLMGERKSCLTISNLGAVTVPRAMEAYVRRFDFVLGVQATCPSNCAVVSYGGNLYINLIRDIKEPELERRFFTFLRAQGLHVKIESNQRD